MAQSTSARDVIAEHRAEPPYGYFIPTDQRDPVAAVEPQRAQAHRQLLDRAPRLSAGILCRFRGNSRRVGGKLEWDGANTRFQGNYVHTIPAAPTTNKKTKPKPRPNPCEIIPAWRDHDPP